MFSGGASSTTSGGDASAPSPPDARGFAHASHILLPAELDSVLRWLGNDSGRVSVRAMFGRITMRAVFGRRLGVVVASHEETLRKAKGEKASRGSVDRAAAGRAFDGIARRVGTSERRNVPRGAGYAPVWALPIAFIRRHGGRHPAGSFSLNAERARHPLSKAGASALPGASSLEDASEPTRVSP